VSDSVQTFHPRRGTRSDFQLKKEKKQKKQKEEQEEHKFSKS